MSKILNFKQKSFWSFEIGAWNLFGICDLEFLIPVRQ
jgi:hypothetical protein